ncbi:alpha/beta fold hydrolase [Nocardia sp. NEAU-G5]|uniref:Alpha/beta fold hydrolase n=1 Tax=Nocardia albiluteola TaxID=2842303 RepID=A0ABS6AY70_9NOCA|nr:alpha/beta fold hydrolase [Nocardia albiluteola]MBU3061949.1 alpha/beta fold hydrolase [Nocardia albiluteola]
MYLARLGTAVATALTAIAAGTATAAPALGPDPTYSYPSAAAAQAADPGQAPPAANNWACRPGPGHPHPVVLIHGFSNQTLTWNTMSPVLAREGYCVFSLTYGTSFLGPVFGSLTPIEDSAHQVAAFIDRVRAATGADQVSLVGHSNGGAVAFYYLNHLGGAPKVSDLVSMAGSLHGSTVSGAATAGGALMDVVGAHQQVTSICGPCALTPGSPFLHILNPDPRVAPRVRFTAIVTKYDEIATPYTTGLIDDAPNAHNVVVQDLCPTDYTDHLELTYDPVAVAVVRNALDPGHPQPVSCTTVLPFVGLAGH